MVPTEKSLYDCKSHSIEIYVWKNVLFPVFVEAAGDAAASEKGVTSYFLWWGLILFGAGRSFTGWISFIECSIEIERKGVLQREWKTFFQRIGNRFLSILLYTYRHG